MLGLYLLAFFIAIIVVVYWAKANDAVPLGGKTKGLLRMTYAENADADAIDPASGASAAKLDALGRTTASTSQRIPD